MRADTARLRKRLLDVGPDGYLSIWQGQRPNTLGMTVHEAITSIRADYVEQWNAYVAARQASDPSVYIERRLAMPEDSKLFARSYVPDVSVGDPMFSMSDLVPRPRDGKIPSFDLNSTNFAVHFDDLWWDDVRIDHDGSFTGERVSWWFNRWFPSLNADTPRAEGVRGFIHSATVNEKWISVDFGTANVSALFNILTVAQRCGAKTARVTSTRQPA